MLRTTADISGRRALFFSARKGTSRAPSVLRRPSPAGGTRKHPPLRRSDSPRGASFHACHEPRTPAHDRYAHALPARQPFPSPPATSPGPCSRRPCRRATSPRSRCSSCAPSAAAGAHRRGDGGIMMDARVTEDARATCGTSAPRRSRRRERRAATGCRAPRAASTAGPWRRRRRCRKALA